MTDPSIFTAAESAGADGVPYILSYEQQEPILWPFPAPRPIGETGHWIYTLGLPDVLRHLPVRIHAW